MWLADPRASSAVKLRAGDERDRRARDGFTADAAGGGGASLSVAPAAAGVTCVNGCAGEEDEGVTALSGGRSSTQMLFSAARVCVRTVPSRRAWRPVGALPV